MILELDTQFISIVTQIVQTVLQNNNVLQGEWHLGKVESVVSNYALNVYVDGSLIPQVIPCNPNIRFIPNDEVWVHYVNGDSKNKFIPYKRATGTEATDGGSAGAPLGDMLKSTYDSNNSGIVDNAEAVNGKAVNDSQTTLNNLWTASKINDVVNALKTSFDANGNGIVDNAEAVNGKNVDDNQATTGNLWTASKIQTEITNAIPQTTSDTNYVYTQSVPASSWVVTHNLGKYVSATIVDSGGSVVLGEITYNSINQVTITFSGSFSGKAYFN